MPVIIEEFNVDNFIVNIGEGQSTESTHLFINDSGLQLYTTSALKILEINRVGASKFNGELDFTVSPRVPSATEITHAVNLKQVTDYVRTSLAMETLQSVYNNTSSGVNGFYGEVPTQLAVSNAKLYLSQGNASLMLRDSLNGNVLSGVNATGTTLSLFGKVKVPTATANDEAINLEQLLYEVESSSSEFLTHDNLWTGLNAFTRKITVGDDQTYIEVSPSGFKAISGVKEFNYGVNGIGVGSNFITLPSKTGTVVLSTDINIGAFDPLSNRTASQASIDNHITERIIGGAAFRGVLDVANPDVTDFSSLGYPALKGWYYVISGSKEISGLSLESGDLLIFANEVESFEELVVSEDLKLVEASDRTVVRTFGAQEIDGRKRFTSSPEIPTPANNFDAATKEYVDGVVNSEFLRAETEEERLEAEIISVDGSVVHLQGDESISGIKTFTGKIKGVVGPTEDNDLTPKGYVDNNFLKLLNGNPASPKILMMYKAGSSDALNFYRRANAPQGLSLGWDGISFWTDTQGADICYLTSEKSCLKNFGIFDYSMRIGGGVETPFVYTLSFQNKSITVAGLDDIPTAESLVHTTGNESIAGIKTFTGGIIVPAPTNDTHASTKKYVDDIISTHNNSIDAHPGSAKETDITLTRAFENQGSTDVVFSSAIKFIKADSLLQFSNSGVAIQQGETSFRGRVQLFNDEASLVHVRNGRTAKIGVTSYNITSELPTAYVSGSTLTLDVGYPPVSDTDATPKSYVDEKTARATVSAFGTVKLGTALDLTLNGAGAFSGGIVGMNEQGQLLAVRAGYNEDGNNIGVVKIADDMDDVGEISVPSAAQVKAYVTSVVSTVYRYKGSVATFADLPTSGQNIGDTWNVEQAYQSHPAGTNFAWTGLVWDSLAGGVSPATVNKAGVIKLANSATLGDKMGEVGVNTDGRAGIGLADGSNSGTVRISGAVNMTSGGLVGRDANGKLFAGLATTTNYGVVMPTTSIDDPDDNKYITVPALKPMLTLQYVWNSQPVFDGNRTITNTENIEILRTVRATIHDLTPTKLGIVQTTTVNGLQAQRVNADNIFEVSQNGISVDGNGYWNPSLSVGTFSRQGDFISSKVFGFRDGAVKLQETDSGGNVTTKTVAYVESVPTPTENSHIANKAYVDEKTARATVSAFGTVKLGTALDLTLNGAGAFSGGIVGMNEQGQLLAVRAGYNGDGNNIGVVKIADDMDDVGEISVPSASQVKGALDLKADKSTTYTKTEVNTALNLKADKSTTYTKIEVNTALEGKANNATTLAGYGITDAYTKPEVDLSESLIRGTYVEFVISKSGTNETVRIPRVNAIGSWFLDLDDGNGEQLQVGNKGFTEFSFNGKNNRTVKIYGDNISAIYFETTDIVSTARAFLSRLTMLSSNSIDVKNVCYGFYTSFDTLLHIDSNGTILNNIGNGWQSIGKLYIIANKVTGALGGALFNNIYASGKSKDSTIHAGNVYTGRCMYNFTVDLKSYEFNTSWVNNYSTSQYSSFRYINTNIVSSNKTLCATIYGSIPVKSVEVYTPLLSDAPNIFKDYRSLTKEGVILAMGSLPVHTDGGTHRAGFQNISILAYTDTTDTWTVTYEGTDYSVANCPAFTNDDAESSIRNAYVLLVARQGWTVLL